MLTFGPRYENGYKLSGVIYLHRISDFRVGGTAVRNLKLLRGLCGDESLSNVVLVTNMWGEVTLDRGATRELQLATDDNFFKPVLQRGATMARHTNTVDSAQAILLRLIHNKPVTLRIQRELVDEGKDISETTAGQELLREQNALIDKHTAQLAEIQKDMEEALSAKDEESRGELEDARREVLESIKKIQHDRDRLSREYVRQKSAAAVRVREALRVAQRDDQERIQAERELQRLNEQLIRNRRASQAERESMMRQIQALQEQQATRRNPLRSLPRTLVDVTMMVVNGVIASLV